MNNCEEQRIIGSKEIYLLSPDFLFYKYTCKYSN